MYLGTYTFFISAALPITEVMAMVVDSEKKVNMIWPVIR